MLCLLPGISSSLISTFLVHAPAFFPKPLPSFFPVLAVANTGSSVGPQNNIGHPAHRYRQMMQVPVLCAREIEVGSKTSVIVFFFFFSGLVCPKCEYDLSFGLRKRDLWYNDSCNEQLGDRLKSVFSPDTILCG